MVSFSSMAMAAALTVSSSSAQQLIFIPTHEHPQQQMMMMTPSFNSLNNNNEPPCRTRRLEPWRQQVREHCRVDATTNCRHIEKEERGATTTTSFEDEINSFFDSIFSPPQSSSQQQTNNIVEYPFDSLVRNMLGFSLNAFDQIMAEATAQQQQPSTIQLHSVEGEGRDEVNEEGVDNYPNEEDVDVGEENYPDVDGEDWDQFDEEQEGFEDVGVGKVSTEEEDKEEDSESAASEDAAVTTMDALVANLAHRSIHRAAVESEEEGIGAQEDITSLFLDNLPKKLFDMGNNILAETTHSRRRLMEGEGKVDPHLQVRERLGRRLTEYHQDLFLHPSDGTVTLYTRGLMSPLASAFAGTSPPPPAFMMRGYHPQEKIVASLGMGLGDDVDQCMESRFNNGDLAGDCNDAVQMFFLAVNDRTLIPPSSPVAMKHTAFMRDMHRAPVAHRQQVYTFTSEAGEMNHLKCMLFWAPTLLLLLLLVMGNVCGGSNDDDEDEEDARDVSFDYSKLPEEDGIVYVSPPCEGFSVENVQPSEPKVYVGVPVQVV